MVRWVSLDGVVESTGKPVRDIDPSEPLPENYYLDTLGVRQVWEMGYRGEGVGVAVIDSGVFMDRDFTEDPKKPHTRVVVQKSFNSETPSDEFGHGTLVAGIIGGHGGASDGMYAGIAPGVTLINLKIMDDYGMAYESDTVAALQWVYENKEAYNIRVVNLSIQSTLEQSYHTSPLDAAAEILWFNGVVVVASAGNYQSDSEINPILAAPANDPFIITVGAVDENDTPNRGDDFLAPFSAEDDSLPDNRKPEVLAPGHDIINVLSSSSSWRFEHPDRVILDGEYIRLSGTSLAAPMVAGAAALLVQAEPDLTPDQVKYRLISTGSTINDCRYLDVFTAVTTPTTESANTGIEASQLLWTGDEPIVWGSVAWNSVAWNSVAWNSVAWNSVAWNSVAWNSVAWNE
jgi:serine protease AprX